MTRPACPGSLRPVPTLLPGDQATCDFCSMRVAVVRAPMPGLHDPWRGSRDARLASHLFEKPASPQGQAGADE